jgi:hypothetical protein
LVESKKRYFCIAERGANNVLKGYFAEEDYIGVCNRRGCPRQSTKGVNI